VRNERGVPDVAWFAVNGTRMTEEEWNKPHAKCLVVRLAPAQPGDVSLLIMLNAANHGVDFTIPPGGTGKWEAILDTAAQLEGEHRATGETVIAEGRSLIVWEARA
jgi:glycogen operon protein